ncbi:MAG TPA: FliA/WhiG family RNA polymerase sigma factor [Verrucomicrobiae bacterium]|nr:FliA/WhiG family RNA polymerase sigma factor [Verrucomicrobiae bacterium]
MKPRSSATESPSVATEVRPTPQELWKRYHRRNDPTVENALVEQYIPLVRTVMGRLAMTLPEHVDHDDLNSAGLIGLLQAMRNFDPTCGTSFETYARLRIRGAMLDELRRMDWVPRTIHEKARRVQEVLNQLEQKLGRAPNEEQMAHALNIPVREYTELLDEIRPAAFVCLDSSASSDGNDSGNLYEVVANPHSDNPVDEASRRELKDVVLKRLNQLPEIQRKVLALYYHEDLHLREIAEVFGLTESRICQIHSQAIMSIRAYIQRYEAGMAGNATPPKLS